MTEQLHKRFKQQTRVFRARLENVRLKTRRSRIWEAFDLHHCTNLRRMRVVCYRPIRARPFNGRALPATANVSYSISVHDRAKVATFQVPTEDENKSDKRKVLVRLHL